MLLENEKGNCVRLGGRARVHIQRPHIHKHPVYKRGNGGGGRNESGAVRGGLLINQKPNQGSPYQQMPKGKHERGARGGGGKIAMEEREKRAAVGIYTFHCSPGSSAQMSAAQDNTRPDVLHSSRLRECQAGGVY